MRQQLLLLTSQAGSSCTPQSQIHGTLCPVLLLLCGNCRRKLQQQPQHPQLAVRVLLAETARVAADAVGLSCQLLLLLFEHLAAVSAGQAILVQWCVDTGVVAAVGAWCCHRGCCRHWRGSAIGAGTAQGLIEGHCSAVATVLLY